MSKIKILDCTLRDGGYINDWNFSFNNIKSMIKKLNNAKIDIIEVGFLEDSYVNPYNKNRSFFNTIEQIEQIIPEKKLCEQYVAMMRLGNLTIESIKPYDGKSIDGIRITFNISDAGNIREACEAIKAKGYKLYIQPVSTTTYNLSKLEDLINEANEICPYGFYIVDTMGILMPHDLGDLFKFVDDRLNKDIVRGFHSHNNLQMSYSNAQFLAGLESKNDIIIDASIDGMGRGAGNLHTELITEYLNNTHEYLYNTEYLLEIMDEFMVSARKEYTWGYSVPYYLAAIKNCHPSYAKFLIDKKTLSISAISKILNMINEKNNKLFNNDLISSIYLNFQKHNYDDMEDKRTLKDAVK